MSETKTCGHVTVELMCRLAGGEPQSLGFVQLPLTIRSVATNTIEGHLDEAVQVARITLERIFHDGPVTSEEHR